jgi:hypothetical protein
MSYQHQLRRGIASLWTSANPTLPEGVQGYETDTKKMKIGDGTTAWTSLPYWYDDAAKQDALVSGTSIKTINSESLLGSGNLVIEGGGGGSITFDGGSPTSDYSGGPAFDCGGVT